MLPKLVITDIDGVWTDGGMYYTGEGDVMKRFSVKDGWGVIFLRELGIPVAIMTGENTQIVQKRADKLKIKYCYLGVKDKVVQAEELCNELGIQHRRLPGAESGPQPPGLDPHRLSPHQRHGAQ